MLKERCKTHHHCCGCRVHMGCYLACLYSQTSCALLQERYEKHHHCVYNDDALEAAVALSTRYVADRFHPDKAIDVMDEAASRVRIQAHHTRRANALEGFGGHAGFWESLVQVLDAKEISAKVCFQTHTCDMTWDSQIY